jgi:putative oxidoreductase
MFVFAVQGGGYEFPVFWAIVCFALTLLGDGAHAFKPFGISTSPGRAA